MDPQLKRMTEGRFKGKLELCEGVLVGNKAYAPVEQLITESTKKIIREAIEYQCLAVFTFAISRPGEKNANGRIYGVDLWQNVIDKSRGKSFDGLMDHPDYDSDGSTKDVWCVLRNIRFNADKTLVLADAYIFGQWVQLVLDKMRAGGSVGLSTVGYGDFLRDGITVDPEDFDLDRPADHVLHPSYGVFGTIEDEIQRPNRRESIEQVDKPVLQEQVTREQEIPQGEKKTMNKQEARQFEIMITTLKKQAEAVTDPRRRLEEFKGVLELFDDVHENVKLREALEVGVKSCESDIQKLIEAALEHPNLIQESEKKLTEAQSAYEKKILESTDLGKELEGTKLKLEAAEKLLDELKEFAKNVKQAYMTERTKRVSAVVREDHDRLREYAEKARDTLNTVLAENKTLKGTIEQKIQENTALQGTLNRLKEAVLKQDSRVKLEKETQAAHQVTLSQQELIKLIESVPTEVRNYVDAKMKHYPELETYRMSLYECTTLLDVQQTFIKVRRLHEQTQVFSTRAKVIG